MWMPWVVVLVAADMVVEFLEDQVALEEAEEVVLVVVVVVEALKWNKAMQVVMGLMPVPTQLEEAEAVLDSREQRDRHVLQEMAEMDMSYRLHQSCILGSLVEEAVQRRSIICAH
jgi:hypothetical protein